MLRRLVAVAFLVAMRGRRAGDRGAGGRPAAAGITGVFLTTHYPALTVRAGETTTVDLSVHNSSCRRRT